MENTELISISSESSLIQSDSINSESSETQEFIIGENGKPELPSKNKQSEPLALTGSNFYVPWDTANLTKFQDYISVGMGSAINIGILVLAIVAGVALITSLVRHFSRG